MARAVPGARLAGRAGGELAAGRVDAEDADEVGAEVWHEEELSRRVDVGGVWVRCVLARVRARGCHVEFELLQDLAARLEW